LAKLWKTSIVDVYGDRVWRDAQGDWIETLLLDVMCFVKDKETASSKISIRQALCLTFSRKVRETEKNTTGVEGLQFLYPVGAELKPFWAIIAFGDTFPNVYASVRLVIASIILSSLDFYKS
jgi:hypothetical protein